MLKEATISERKIVNAFIELLEESSLEQISITDIIKKANLSRPTFYYYYSNKEDLVETTFSKILDKVSSILQEDMTYQEGVVTEMLRYLKENQKLCLTLMTHIPNINEMIRELATVSVKSKAPILLTGKTGVGKTKMARLVYEWKKQKRMVSGNFVELNCATLRGGRLYVCTLRPCQRCIYRRR